MASSSGSMPSWRLASAFPTPPGPPNLSMVKPFCPGPNLSVWPGAIGWRCHLAGHLVGEEYLWKWDTRILEPGKAERPKADFRQSSFLGMPLSPAMLEQMSQSHLPELNQAGLIERFILERMDGHNSLEEIARQVAARFPGRFAQASEALGRVQELARKYSR